VTGDETWVYLRQVGRKQSNDSWIEEEESSGTTVRRSKYEPKILVSIFFKSTGPVLMHPVERSKKVDHFYYINRCLKPLVKELHRFHED